MNSLGLPSLPRQASAGGALSPAETRPFRAPLGSAIEFLSVLWALDHRLELLSRGMKRSFGVSGRERFVIKVVGSQPGISAGEVAAVLHVDPSTLTGTLRQLVSRGLIRRTQHPDDARRAVLQLTARGSAIDRLQSGTIEARVRSVLARTPRRKVNIAAQVLNAITERLH